MNNNEAVNWIINISSDIGKTEHRDLWHYEQALAEIKEMLETAQPERKKGKWLSTCTGWIYCSECGSEPPNESNYRSKFCPNCGSYNGGC